MESSMIVAAVYCAIGLAIFIFFTRAYFKGGGSNPNHYYTSTADSYFMVVILMASFWPLTLLILVSAHFHDKSIDAKHKKKWGHS